MSDIWLKAPEGPLVEVTEKIIKALPSNIQTERKLRAAKFLRELVKVVRDWNIEFIRLLKTYPGFSQSTEIPEYRIFFERLALYKESLDKRYDEVKYNLCRPLKHTLGRYEEDFDWMKKENLQEYKDLRYLIESAYGNEDGVIDMASDVIFAIANDSAPENDKNFEQRIKDDKFLQWHANNYDKPLDVISEYEKDSRAGLNCEMCNLYSLTKGQEAIRQLTKAMRDTTGNLPPALSARRAAG